MFGYPDLARTVRIPPDGQLFFPLVGHIAVDGVSIPELRKILENGLETADEQRIATGDRISVRVYRHEDLSLATIVPSSGRVGVPLAGEVDVVGLTVEEASAAIAEGLSPYVVKPSVSTTIEAVASGHRAARAIRRFLETGEAAARAFSEATRLFSLGESLGGVESLIGYPWTMSHAAFPPEEKRRKGITEATVRLSVGIEHADDLCADLGQALERAAAQS